MAVLCAAPAGGRDGGLFGHSRARQDAGGDGEDKEEAGGEERVRIKCCLQARHRDIVVMYGSEYVGRMKWVENMK